MFPLSPGLMSALSLVFIWLWCIFSPDSCDLMGALDDPFGVPLLDCTSVTHPTDILVRLDETDTVMGGGSPRLGYPIIPHDRLREMW